VQKFAARMPLLTATNTFAIRIISGLGFCHGKNYFCRDSRKKPGKTRGKNYQKLAKSKTP